MKTKRLLPAVLSSGAALSIAVGAFVHPAEAQRNQSADSLYRGAHTMHGKTVIIPIGVDFEGRIDHTIGSSVSKPGERFEVEVSSPVLANGTDVLIPAGSAVIGEVVECIPSSRCRIKRAFPSRPGNCASNSRACARLTALLTRWWHRLLVKPRRKAAEDEADGAWNVQTPTSVTELPMSARRLLLKQLHREQRKDFAPSPGKRPKPAHPCPEFRTFVRWSKETSISGSSRARHFPSE